MNTIAVIFAGGKGTRLTHADGPKQFVEIGGKSIVGWTLDIFQKSPAIDSIYIVSLESHLDVMRSIVSASGFTKVRAIVAGGEYAMESIANGLRAAQADGNPDDSVVLIHDGVRPIINANLIDSIVASVVEHGNGITSAAAFETLAASKDNGATIDSVTERTEMYTLQAPQAFRLGPIVAAHTAALDAGIHDRVVDQAHLIDSLPADSIDSSLRPMALVPGVRGNIKITTFDDINYFEYLLDSGKYADIVTGAR